jgi:DNA polymerase IV
MRADRRILHLDMDAYFAALEVQACPFLKGQPVVVGALPGSRGVVASASYEAREYGIRAGMPAAQARRMCPQTQFIPCHPGLYIDTSRRILRHLLSVTAKVEMFSIDEAFLDVTDLIAEDPEGQPSWSAAQSLAGEIAGSIEREFNLTCSIGVGPNKLIAKMASKLHKPRGITTLGGEAFRSRFWHRPVDDLFGVGGKTSSSLMIFGIETIGDLAHTHVDFLRGRFGVFGEALHAMAWGEDASPVVAAHDAPAAKSLGHEHTVTQDIQSPDEGLTLLLALTDRVARKLREEGCAGSCVTIKLRYSDFSSLTRQRSLAHPVHETRDVFRVAKDLFLRNYCGEGLRLLGLTVGGLTATRGRKQMGLFPEDRRHADYQDTLDRIRREHGEASLQPAGAMKSIAASAPSPSVRSMPTRVRAGSGVGSRIDSRTDRRIDSCTDSRAGSRA